MPPLIVHPTSGIPLYRQLVDQIRAQILGKHLAPNDFLPSVRQVAESLQINPMTVSKAYSLLEREGVVELVRGQGMRVVPPTSTSNRTKSDALFPLLQQVAAAARQLSLPPDQVIKQLKPLLEDTHDE